MKKQREINWTGKSGSVKAIVTAEHGVEVNDEVINIDGHEITSTKTTVIENTDITIVIGPRRITGMFISEPHAKKVGVPMVLLAKYHHAIRISDKEVAKEIAEAVAKVKAETMRDKDYQRVIANREAEKDYQDSRAKISKAMNI